VEDLPLVEVQVGSVEPGVGAHGRSGCLHAYVKAVRVLAEAVGRFLRYGVSAVGVSALRLELLLGHRDVVQRVEEDEAAALLRHGVGDCRVDGE